MCSSHSRKKFETTNRRDASNRRIIWWNDNIQWSSEARFKANVVRKSLVEEDKGHMNAESEASHVGL